MNTKKIKILLGILLLAIGFNLFNSLTDSLYAQKKSNKQYKPLLDKSIITKEPIIVVEKYWTLIENGFASKANELRTGEFRDFAIIINRNKYEKSREDLILEWGWRFISIDEVIIHAEDKWEIAVRIRNKKNVEFYRFFTVVKNEKNWKILNITP